MKKERKFNEMRVEIIENEYRKEKRLYDKPYFVSAFKINSVLKSLENEGCTIRGVRILLYEDYGMERVYVFYD